VRIGLKETSPPITLCYCFDHTLDHVREEITRTGVCRIPELVAEEVKAGRCACELKNPSGACCLGELRGAVKNLKDEMARGKSE
jgi:hypothetical protein